MKTYIIYRHTLNNKQYIGYSSQTLEERLLEHTKSSKSNSENHFHRAIRKYGVENIVSEILVTADSKTEAKRKEMFYISLHDTFKNGYNMTLGGDGGNTLEKYTEEEMADHRRLKSQISTGMNNGNARPDVTVEAMVDVLVQLITKNDYHGKNILQSVILEELKRTLDISIEAVKRRTKNVSGLMTLVNEKLKELSLGEVKYDPYYRSEEERKQLAKAAGWFGWVTDGSTNKQVTKDEIDKYLAENTTYKRGRTL